MRWADVVIESFTPGVMDAWGLGPEALRAINPRLIVMATSLMGQTGPLSTFAGFGNLAGAITGFYELTGWPDRAPAGPFLAYTDYVAPKYMLCSLMAALDWRRRTGEGQVLDLAQAEASIHFLAPAILDHVVNGVEPTRAGNTDRWAHPHGVFPCAGDDQWVAVACETDEQRAALAGIVGALDDEAIAAWTAGRAADEIEKVLQAVGVPVHGVQNSAACWRDPQLVHRNHYLTVPHPVHDSCVVEGPRVVLSTHAGGGHPGQPDDGRAQRPRAARVPRLRRRPRHRPRHRRRPRLTSPGHSRTVQRDDHSVVSLNVRETGQRPFHFGGRFSAKALGPSMKSSEATISATAG